MTARNRTLIVLAVGAALAAPAGYAQLVQGQAGARLGAAVPDPVPAVQQTVDRTAQTATGTAAQAQDRVKDTADAAQQRVDSTARTAQDTAQNTAQTAQDTAQTATESVPPAPPAQAQGSVNASAHASVTQRALWDKLDADRDGAISAVEADADAEFDAGFARMDSDDSGSISIAEYGAYARTEPVPGTAHASAGSQVAVDSLWRQYDADADGKLSATEVKADADISGSFQAMDDDSDGFVTESEYRAYAQANRKPGTSTP